MDIFGLKSVVRKAIKLTLMALSLLIRNFVPKKAGLVIMQGTSLSRYCENTRYFYEYLQEKGDFEAYWDTSDRRIYDYLATKGYKVLWHNSFKAYFSYLRARIVVGTGSYYPDCFKAVGMKTKKYCLFHGSGPKVITTTWETLDKTLKEVFNHHKYDFFNTTSVFDCVMKGRLVYKMSHSKLVINGYPRCDHLFDEKQVKSMHKEKSISKSFFKELNDSSKVLLYAPTFRPYDLGNSFPLSRYDDFDLEKLETYLKTENMYLLISLHPKIMKSFIITSDYIRFIDTEKDPFFDIDLLLPEVDILIGDYSTIHTDFAILDRPQIYVMPDYDEYFWKRGFLEDFRENLGGKEASNFNNVLELIEGYIENPSVDSNFRTKLLRKYYDVKIRNACEKNHLFLKEIARSCD